MEAGVYVRITSDAGNVIPAFNHVKRGSDELLFRCLMSNNHEICTCESLTKGRGDVIFSAIQTTLRSCKSGLPTNSRIFQYFDFA